MSISELNEQYVRTGRFVVVRRGCLVGFGSDAK